VKNHHLMKEQAKNMVSSSTHRRQVMELSVEVKKSRRSATSKGANRHPCHGRRPRITGSENENKYLFYKAFPSAHLRRGCQPDKTVVEIGSGAPHRRSHVPDQIRQESHLSSVLTTRKNGLQRNRKEAALKNPKMEFV
jgi:hypothetical protein